MSSVPTATPWEALMERGREDGRLAATGREQAMGGRFAELPEDLHPALVEGLERIGIDRLWSHQADAFEAAREGPVIVTTGTASGKSLAFNLPV
ncbi:MAG: DEAD/DEAH box helicase, partial [Actinomycetota bacterium]|nr:DEAD/DEAH box helicase [Actinomycetota bacterium]